MDAREIEILRYFESGPAPVKPLLNSQPKSTVYRAICKLVDEHYLVKEKTSYRLLPAGREALEAFANQAVAPIAADLLGRHLPHLRHVPTAFHRALLELIACAIVARQHRIRASHHPAFVVFGPKMKWKTWITKAACYMAGGDPTHDVIYLGTESGRSMLCRKGAKGQRVTARAALDKRVIGLDEYLRAKQDVRQLVQVYLLGEISVPDENEELSIQPVPIVTLNPREDRDALDERTGLDEAMLRRSVVADLGGVDIPQSLLAEGDVLLDRIRSLGPAEFPPPRRLDWEPRDEMKRILLSALDRPDRLAGIDITMIAMLATGATAWREPDDALRLVATNYLTIVEQLGWAKPDWRLKMDSLANSAATPTSESTPPLTENPFDYTGKIRGLKEVCDRLGLQPVQAEERLRVMEDIQRLGFTAEWAAPLATELKRMGLKPVEAAKRISDYIRDVGSLEGSRTALETRVASLEVRAADAERRLAEAKQTMAGLNWDPARIMTLRELERGLTEAALNAADVATILASARDIAQRAGVADADAAVLARHTIQYIADELKASEGADLHASMKLIAQAAVKGSQLEDEIAQLDARRAKVESERDDLSRQSAALAGTVARAQLRTENLDRELRATVAQLEDARSSLESLTAKTTTLARQHVTMAGDIAFAHEVVAFLYGNVGTLDRFWGALRDAVAKGMSATAKRAFSDEARARILQLLRHAVDPEIVPRAELLEYKRNARESATIELRSQLEPAANALRMYEESAKRQREEADRILTQLRLKGGAA